jgi:glucose/arabinose dehydrogenase
MYRRLAALAAAVLLVASCAAGATPAAGSLVSIGAGLTGAAGLTATVYAKGLPKVAALALDPQGRLWVATSDSTDQGKDGVFVVAKQGADPVEVVSALHTPLGLLWYQDSLYVASKGRVDAYRDFNGTTFATHRTVLTLPDGIGETNGLVASPSGALLLGISAPCDHCTPTSKYSAAILSFQPDGTDLQVYASGIRAPIGLAYYPGTNDLLVTMNQRNDLGTDTPGDWLALVEPGQTWGFPACYGQGGTVCNGVPAPVAVLDKHAAVSGIAIVTGQLGATVGTSALVAEWTDGKVQQVALRKVVTAPQGQRKEGSSYTGSVSTFVGGLKNPVPVLLGSRGSVFIGDWTSGTVYRVSTS